MELNPNGRLDEMCLGHFKMVLTSCLGLFRDGQGRSKVIIVRQAQEMRFHNFRAFGGVG